MSFKIKSPIIVVASLILASITLFHFSVAAYAEESPDGWERLPDMPEVRSEMESVAVGEKIYVVGGLNNREQATDTVFIFDTMDNSWTSGTSMPISLHHAGAAYHDGNLYVVGGYLDGWIPTDSLLIYDLENDSWSEVASMPTSRGALTTQFIDGKLYAIGGFNGSVLAENEVYDPIKDSWESKSQMPTPREHLTSAVVDDILHVIGGRTGQNNLHAAETYDYKSDRWETIEPLPTARSGLTASVLGDAIFVFGGEGHLGTFEENEVYIPGEGWLEQSPMPISRHGLASSTVGDSIYLIGGGIAPGSSYSAITERYYNTAIPEFGMLIGLTLIASIFAMILFSKSKTMTKLH